MTAPSAASRIVFFHADDFGFNAAVNAGIVEGFRRGPLTGTSILANAPAVEQAIASWNSLESDRRAGGLPSSAARALMHDVDAPFDVGVHVNLTQGMPLSDEYPDELRGADGCFLGIGGLFAKLIVYGDRFRSALVREIDAQIEHVDRAGMRPSRVDGHQYVEMLPPVTAALRAVLERRKWRRLRIPAEVGLEGTTLRQGRIAAWGLARIKRAYARRFAATMRSAGFCGSDVYFGTAHAGRITCDLLGRFLKAAGSNRTIEIGTHPGTNDVAEEAGPWHDPLSRLRPVELATLTSPEVIACLTSHGCRLGRFVECEADR